MVTSSMLTQLSSSKEVSLTTKLSTPSSQQARTIASSCGTSELARQYGPSQGIIRTVSFKSASVSATATDILQREAKTDQHMCTTLVQVNLWTRPKTKSTVMLSQMWLSIRGFTSGPHRRLMAMLGPIGIQRSSPKVNLEGPQGVGLNGQMLSRSKAYQSKRCLKN